MNNQPCKYAEFQGEESRDLLLVIMVDALRWDYTQRIPYFRQLTSEGPTVRLREPFGFNSWPSLFRGPAVEESRFMFVFHPEQSPYRFLRVLDPDFPWPAGSRPAIHDTVASRLPSYTKAYANTLDVPYRLLPFLDFGWQRSPWDADGDHRPITQDVADAGWRWCVLGWPFLNASVPGDREICKEACRVLRKRPRFLFVHFQELDGLSHTWGPGSRQVTEAGIRISNYVEQVVREAEDQFDTVDLLLFGDHGMVSTVGTIDLWKRIQDSPLRLGEDYVCFLDSTMARFWPLRQGVEEALISQLHSVPGGRLLEDSDRQKYGLRDADARFCFLANPGMVIAPSFFDMHGGIPRGMHGYDPDCGDNQSSITYHSLRPAPWPFPKRSIDTWEIHSLCRYFLFDKFSRESTISPLPYSSATIMTAFGKSATAKVNEDLRIIVSAVRQEFQGATGILLTGSFGRGEGAMWQSAEGEWFAVNDYDLIMIDPAASLRQAAALGRQLAGILRVDGVDLAVWPAVADYWGSGEVPLFIYDLRYGTKVIWGDDHLLDSLASYAPQQIPLREGLQLLFNRMAGIHLALTRARRPEDCRFAWNQVTKAAVAVCDWRLLEWGDYTTCIVDKIPRFEALAQAAGLAPADRLLVSNHLQRKLKPSYGSQELLEDELDRISLLLQTTIIAAAGVVTGNRYPNRDDFYMRFPYDAPVNGCQVEADNLVCLERSKRAGWSIRIPGSHFSLRNALYAALTATIRCGVDRAAGEQLLSTIVEAAPDAPDGDAGKLLASLWECWCHSA